MQGFNMGRYVPPEHEGTKSANQLAGKHALGARARKAREGILTVRFEMPFAIWCTSCPQETIIGQGVRFNAEKKKVGSYYSSPIFSFQMKHADCGGWIEIRTDPKNSAYQVTEGARKRDTGEDEAKEGDLVLRSEEEKERIRNDAFAALEVTIDDREQAKKEKTRIDELVEDRSLSWDDPYAANKRLRRVFRTGRKLREKDAAATEDLQERMSLGMDLLPETEADRRRAQFVEFGDEPEALQNAAISKAQTRALFSPSNTRPKPTDMEAKVGKLKADLRSGEARKSLKIQLGVNSRVAVDPFLVGKESSVSKTFAGIKRKQSADESHGQPKTAQDDEIPAPKGVLVDYDSD